MPAEVVSFETAAAKVDALLWINTAIADKDIPEAVRKEYERTLAPVLAKMYDNAMKAKNQAERTIAGGGPMEIESPTAHQVPLLGEAYTSAIKK